MNFSEYSLLMAVVWSDALILLAYILRRRLWFARIFGVRALLVFFSGCAFRLLVCNEFLPALEIRVPQMNCMGDFFRNSLLLGGFRVPVSALLLALWFSVGAVKIVRVFRAYRRDITSRRALPRAGPQVEHCLSQIVNKPDRKKIRVVSSYKIRMPCVAGIRYGIICLPKRSWKNKELRLVLRHEYIHFRHHDALIYLLTALFCSLFWWNPCVYLLLRHVQEILEFRTDAEVLRSRSRTEAIHYCRTLVKFAGEGAGSAQYYSASELERRVGCILDRPFSAWSRVLFSSLLLSAAVVLLAMSYMVIFQPFFLPEVEAPWHVVAVGLT